MPSPALIVLEDGAAFDGEALAGHGAVGGEIVFNTSMAGYQEIATDPSYCGQLVTFTFPMNGNYGADPGATSPTRRTREPSSPARSRTTVSIGTRARPGSTGSPSTASSPSAASTRAPSRAISARRARCGPWSAPRPQTRSICARPPRGLPKMGGLDLAKVVTCEAAYEAPAPEGAPAPDLHVVAYDFGIKRSMLRVPRAARLSRHRRAGADQRPRSAQARARRRVSQQRARRPGRGRLCGQGRRAAARQDARVRDLPRAPAARAGARPHARSS